MPASCKFTEPASAYGTSDLYVGILDTFPSSFDFLPACQDKCGMNCMFVNRTTGIASERSSCRSAQQQQYSLTIFNFLHGSRRGLVAMVKGRGSEKIRTGIKIFLRRSTGSPAVADRPRARAVSQSVRLVRSRKSTRARRGLGWSITTVLSVRVRTERPAVCEEQLNTRTCVALTVKAADSADHNQKWSAAGRPARTSHRKLGAAATGGGLEP